MSIISSFITFHHITAQRFHELSEAYKLLLDPIRRTALDAQIRIKNARKLRFAAFDNKRKNLQEELEERERAFKKSKGEKDDDEKKRALELERIKEEGRRMMREKEEALAAKEEDKKQKARETEGGSSKDSSENGPPGALTTFRLFKRLLN